MEKTDKIKAIISHLGKGWRLDERRESKWSWTILGENGAQLFIRDMQKKRLAISGQNLERCYYEDVPKITVSLDRTPQAIADDINKRLLPKYYPMLEESKKKRADEKVKKNALETVCNLFKKVTEARKIFAS